MPLTDIATINVSTTSAGVTRAGFGVPMILSMSASWVERFRVYSNLTAVGVDFAANTPEYLAASAIFSQSPSVTSIVIGRAALQPTQQYSIGVQTVSLNARYPLRIAGPTGVVFPSQVAAYGPGVGATGYVASNTWSRGTIVVGQSGGGGNSGSMRIYSCIGQSNGVGPFGMTGIGSGSGPSGTSAAIADGQVWWMYAGTGGTGAVTNDAIISGLQAAVDYLGAPTFSGTLTGQFSTSLQGSVLSRTLQILANAPSKFFAVEVQDRNVLNAVQNHADPGVATDLAAVKLANNSWYGLITLFNSAAMIQAAAAWVETNTKLYPAASMDTAVEVVAQSLSTDVAVNLQNSSYTRSWVFAHPSPDEFADAAEMGKFFPISPGGETWRMKTLPGVTKKAHTDTEISNMKAKNATFYYDMAGVAVVGGNAVDAFGEYIDQVRFIDWYTANLQADLANLVIGVNKIPFTNPGFDMVAAKIVARNQAGIDAGGIAANPAPVVIVPDVANVTTKAQRELSGVSTIWTLAGAVHHITVSVTANF